MRKRMGFLVAALITGMMAAGCGGTSAKGESESMAILSEAETVVQETEETETEGTEEAQETEEKTVAEETSETGKTGYENNFAVDSEAAAAFGKKIQEAVMEKDLEALADMTSFPTYVGFEEGGIMPATREEFMEIGADRIFTDSLVQSVEAADVNALTPSMAGFVLSEENGAPNIIFGVVNGSLAIQGINY